MTVNLEKTNKRIYRYFKEIDFFAGTTYVQAGQSRYLFLQGDFAGARACAEEGFQLSRRYNYVFPAGANLLTLAWLACIDSRYEQAKQLCEDARTFSRNSPVIEYYIRTPEAIANFGLGNYEAAQGDNRLALAGLLKKHNTRRLLNCLPGSALLAARESQMIWSAEILALAFNHPITRTGWLHKWQLITQLRANLESQLGSDAFNAAWERGATLDLEDTVRRILAEQPSPPAPLPTGISFGHSQSEWRKSSSESPLPESLTKRELEILNLIADGMQNQEIASELFIALGTVKTHINAIFSKLDATNRTQAVTRGRELGLLP